VLAVQEANRERAKAGRDRGGAVALRSVARACVRSAGLEIGPEALVVKTEALPAKGRRFRTSIWRSSSARRFDHQRGARGARGEPATRPRSGRPRPTTRRGPSLDLDLAVGPVGAAGDARARRCRASSSNPGLRDHGEPDASDHADRAPHRARRPRRVGSCGGLDRQGSPRRDARAQARPWRRDAGRAADEGRRSAPAIDLGDEAIGPRRSRMSPPSRSGFELGKSTNFEVLRPPGRARASPGCAASRRSATTSSHAPDLDGLTGEILGRYGIVMPVRSAGDRA